MKGPFAQIHRGLVRNGYSPVPLLPRTKRPWVDGWQVLRTTPINSEQAARVLATYPKAGIGVAGGFNQLVPVDIDAEADDIIDRITGILPTPVVAKAGAKGFTTFCRGNVKACKLKDANGRTMVEFLSTGQTVLPPSIHPDTGLPYRWLTRATLLDTMVSDLPEITEAHVEALREALAPFMKAKAVWVPKIETAAPAPTSGRLRAWAMAALRGEAAKIARAMSGGRNNTVYAAGCALGKWVHHRVLPASEIEREVANACVANGLAKETGLRACIASLHSGFNKAINDALPPLPDRRITR